MNTDYLKTRWREIHESVRASLQAERHYKIELSKQETAPLDHSRQRVLRALDDYQATVRRCNDLFDEYNTMMGIDTDDSSEYGSEEETSDADGRTRHWYAMSKKRSSGTGDDTKGDDHAAR